MPQGWQKHQGPNTPPGESLFRPFGACLYFPGLERGSKVRANAGKNNVIEPRSAASWGTMLGVIYRQASLARHALTATASRLRDAATVALLLAVGLPGFTASAVQAGDVLTLDGARLDPIMVPAGVPADIRRVVTLNGDVPLVTYATARSVSGASDELSTKPS